MLASKTPQFIVKSADNNETYVLTITEKLNWTFDFIIVIKIFPCFSQTEIFFWFKKNNIGLYLEATFPTKKPLSLSRSHFSLRKVILMRGATQEASFLWGAFKNCLIPSAFSFRNVSGTRQQPQSLSPFRRRDSWFLEGRRPWK